VAKKTISVGFEPIRRGAGQRRHLVAVVAFDGVVLGDLSTPCEIFGRARGRDGQALYEVRICSSAPEVRSEHVTLRVPWRLSSLSLADTVIVPALPTSTSHYPRSFCARFAELWIAAPRVASICSGAFVLAAAGMLDGLRATTHWLGAAELARRYPGIDVDAGVLYVDHGNVLTSAGATPASWIARARVRRAQRLLETTALAVERVAADTGFGSAAVMREHFGAIVGTTPIAYRRAFCRLDGSHVR
jgi:transcriptional regulator GlxA family with amidase domain